MTASLYNDRLDELVLARLAATPSPRPAELLAAVRRYWPQAVKEEVDAALQRLDAKGSLSQRKPTESGMAAARRFGAAGVPWRQVTDAVLPAHALGWPWEDRRERARLDGREGWAAAIVARDWGLIDAGDPPPTPSHVGMAIVWHRLALPGKLPRQLPKAVMAHFIGRLLEVDAPEWRRGLVQLALRSVGARRADLRALRDGVVAAWLGGRSWTEPSRAVEPDPVLTGPHSGSEPANGKGGGGNGGNGGEPANGSQPGSSSGGSQPGGLEEFARRVREAAGRARTGVFGDRKVFISALWRDLSSRGTGGNIDQFKQRLVEANRRGLLRLYRADLVEQMDPAEVAASATRYLDATFHFVEREVTP
jgi:hypothetical protein